MTPVTKASTTRLRGYCARKKAKKRMVTITVKKSPTHPKNDGFFAVINKTLAEPIKPKMIILAVAAKR